MASIFDFAEALAGADMERDFTGIVPSAIREYADLVVDTRLSDDRRLGLITQLTQLALWTAGPAGTIHFAQESLEHYLVARWLVGLLHRSPQTFIAKMNLAPIQADSIVRRIVSNMLGDEGRATLGALAQQARPWPVAFKNAVQILSGSGRMRQILGASSFEATDLSGVRFESEDLTGVSFRNADLSNTEFIECTLANATFDGAVLSGTSFQRLKQNALDAASFGDLVRFIAIRVDGKTLNSVAAVSRWITQQTRHEVEVLEPCPAAQQLRAIFRKFVQLNGEPRRPELPFAALTRGSRIFADPESIVQAAIRAGYLSAPDFRDRVFRPKGEEYSEIVQFVTRLQVSPGLRAILDESCDRERCPHVPKSSVMATA